MLKQVGGEDLAKDVRRVAEGQSLLDPALTEQVMRRLKSGKDQDPLLASLTSQEQRILDLVAEGRTNRQIANEIFRSEKTVKNYVSNLLSKLGMNSRTEAAVYATRLDERSAHDQRRDRTGT